MAKTKKRPEKMLEYHHQVKLFTWLRDSAEMQPETIKGNALRWIHSSLNGVRLSPGLAMKCKRSGMTKGVSDICLPLNQRLLIGSKEFCYVGLYIELKKDHKSKATPEQIEFGEFVSASDYFFAVAYNWVEAANLIVRYLQLETYAEITEEGINE